MKLITKIAKAVYTAFEHLSKPDPDAKHIPRSRGRSVDAGGYNASIDPGIPDESGEGSKSTAWRKGKIKDVSRP